MTIGDVSEDSVAIVFIPVSIKHEKCIFLRGDIEISNRTISVYVTGLVKKMCDSCLGIYSAKEYVNATDEIRLPDTWIHLETQDNRLTLKKFKITKETKNVKTFEIIIIYYDYKIFLQSGNSILIHNVNNINEKDYFRSLIKRLESHKKQKSSVPKFQNKILYFIQWITLLLSLFSKKLLFITKYSNFGTYADSYLNNLIWLMKPDANDKRENIKKLNYLLSLVADAIIGVIFLNYLVEYFPDDLSRKIVLSAEIFVQSIKDLIYWLTGDPAGFKLNFMFSQILATFYLFYIDTWRAFIAYLSMYLRVTHSVFVWFFHIIGRMGISFQVNIFADVLAVLTCHIHCICFFAARLYNTQMSTLLSLSRLFLGRKKNPLRGRVDSCKYTPEQLFIGTLAFTILLFLLPTTFIYYVVFTLIRILLSVVKGTLNRIQYFVHSLQIYSTFLWLIGSPKVCSKFYLIPEKSQVKSNCLVFHVKPICSSWSESVSHDIPDCIEKPKDFKFFQFLYSLLIGTVY